MPVSVPAARSVPGSSVSDRKLVAVAIGGYVGGRLAASGQDVTFLARGAHLAAIRDHGLALGARSATYPSNRQR